MLIIGYDRLFFLGGLRILALHDLHSLLASSLLALMILDYNLSAFLFYLIEKLLGVTPYLGR